MWKHLQIHLGMLIHNTKSGCQRVRSPGIAIVINMTQKYTSLNVIRIVRGLRPRNHTRSGFWFLYRAIAESRRKQPRSKYLDNSEYITPNSRYETLEENDRLLQNVWQSVIEGGGRRCRIHQERQVNWKLNNQNTCIYSAWKERFGLQEGKHERSYQYRTEVKTTSRKCDENSYCYTIR